MELIGRYARQETINNSGICRLDAAAMRRVRSVLSLAIYFSTNTTANSNWFQNQSRVLAGMASRKCLLIHHQHKVAKSICYPKQTSTSTCKARLEVGFIVELRLAYRISSSTTGWEHYALHQTPQHPSAAPLIPFTSAGILATEVLYAICRVREAIHISRRQSEGEQWSRLGAA